MISGESLPLFKSSNQGKNIRNYCFFCTCQPHVLDEQIKPTFHMLICEYLCDIIPLQVTVIHIAALIRGRAYLHTGFPSSTTQMPSFRHSTLWQRSEGLVVVEKGGTVVEGCGWLTVRWDTSEERWQMREKMSGFKWRNGDKRKMNKQRWGRVISCGYLSGYLTHGCNHACVPDP